jgi:hypothetical protein
MQLLDRVTGMQGNHARHKRMKHRASSSTNKCMPLSNKSTHTSSVVKMQLIDTYQAVFVKL